MRVLFVCTGNICRSPIAEHLFRSLLQEMGLPGVEVLSAGLHAVDGMPAHPAMARSALARGLDLSGHRAQRFSPGTIGPSDLVVVMEELQRLQVLALAEVEPRAVRLLGRFAPGGGDEIDDPIGGPDLAYDRCIDRVRACLLGLAGWLEDEKISRA